MSNSIVRIVHACSEDFGPITRVTGYIKGRQLLPLFNEGILSANPRMPKANRVTGEIIETLRSTPELYQFKSKGLLIGSANADSLERNRYSLQFRRGADGVLDGGHNMLSIGIYMLELATGDDWARSVKNWDQLMEAWDAHLAEIKSLGDELDFYVSTELLIPSSRDADVMEEFRIALIDICAARNNNAQLSQEAKANQRGFYDEIRSRFEAKLPELSKRVEWRLNEWESDDRSPIRVRDLVALACIPLSKLEEYDCLSSEMEFTFNPVHLYSSKAKLSEQFDELMAQHDIAKQQKNGKFELHNTAVGSAFDVLVDFPKVVDWLHKRLPEAYNKSGGKFGRITAVKKPKHGTAKTPYALEPAPYKVPDGFITPLVYGLGALLQVKGCKVSWKTDPIKFLEENFDEMVEGFAMAVTMSGYDPQKVGKDKGSYNLAEKQVQFALMG